MNDFLWDSPIYQKIITEAESRGEARGEARGVETGKMQALSQTRSELSQGLLALVAHRFPELYALAQTRVNKISDTTTLTHLIVQIGTAQTEQDAKNILKSNQTD